MEIERFEWPLFAKDIKYDDLTAKCLKVQLCRKSHAVELVRLWHSRLPVVQNNPWQFAFKAHYKDVTFAVALWNNPSARTLPEHWLELRRMACSPDAPRYTASRMLSQMIKFFKVHCPEREKCISYQDIEVHSGTIYRASNWTPEHFSRPRSRDRSKPRTGTSRAYRSDINTTSIAASGKIRWAYFLDKVANHKEIKAQMECINHQMATYHNITS